MRPRERFALVALWHNAELIKRGVNYEYTVNCDWPSVQHCCRIVHWHLVNLNTVFQQHTFQLKTKVKRLREFFVWREMRSTTLTWLVWVRVRRYAGQHTTHLAGQAAPGAVSTPGRDTLASWPWNIVACCHVSRVWRGEGRGGWGSVAVVVGFYIYV